MRYVRDLTGRFKDRPHYERGELDVECEKLLTDFLRRVGGRIEFPVDTDTLTKLVESYAADLDLYADLSGEGSDVEGVTDFVIGQRPRVRISRELSQDPRRENRLRTTLTHELGHVHFHDHLFQLKESTPTLFPMSDGPSSHRCMRETVLHAGPTDWMEWQAGYVSGAMLMPLTTLKREVSEFRSKQTILSEIAPRSQPGRALIARVASRFATSHDAARVRLLQLGYLLESGSSRALFGPEP